MVYRCVHSEDHQQITLNLQQLKLHISCRLKKRNQSIHMQFWENSSDQFESQVVQTHAYCCFLQLLYDSTSIAGLKHLLNYAPLECDTVYLIAGDQCLVGMCCRMKMDTEFSSKINWKLLLPICRFSSICMKWLRKMWELVRIGNIWAKNKTLHYLNIHECHPLCHNIPYSGSCFGKGLIWV